MSYSIQTFLLACAYGKEKMLSDHEIARLAQHVQDELESEIELMLMVRKNGHATAARASQGG